MSYDTAGSCLSLVEHFYRVNKSKDYGGDYWVIVVQFYVDQ